jgi:hypothetical protein
MQKMPRAWFRDLTSAGIRKDSTIAMIATTASISTSVNPRDDLAAVADPELGFEEATGIDNVLLGLQKEI